MPSDVTKDSLKALAEMAGIEFDDPTLDEILPQIRAARASIEGLDSLDLTDVEPSIIFDPCTE